MSRAALFLILVSCLKLNAATTVTAELSVQPEQNGTQKFNLTFDIEMPPDVSLKTATRVLSSPELVTGTSSLVKDVRYVALSALATSPLPLSGSYLMKSVWVKKLSFLSFTRQLLSKCDRTASVAGTTTEELVSCQLITDNSLLAGTSLGNVDPSFLNHDTSSFFMEGTNVVRCRQDRSMVKCQVTTEAFAKKYKVASPLTLIKAGSSSNIEDIATLVEGIDAFSRREKGAINTVSNTGMASQLKIVSQQRKTNAKSPSSQWIESLKIQLDQISRRGAGRAMAILAL